MIMWGREVRPCDQKKSALVSSKETKAHSPLRYHSRSGKTGTHRESLNQSFPYAVSGVSRRGLLPFGFGALLGGDANRLLLTALHQNGSSLKAAERLTCPRQSLNV